MTKIKHIFSDLDGTLLDDQGRISKVNQQTIETCPIPFSLVSARTPQAMEEIIKQLDLESPQVAFNGGLIFDKKGIIKAETLDYEKVKNLIDQIKKIQPKVNISFYTLENWYIERMSEEIRQEMNFTPQIPKLVDFTDQLKKEKRSKIFKLLLIIPEEKMLEEVKKELEALNIPEIVIQKTWESYLEITAIGAQKSTAISYIAKINHLKKAELAAFGDNENDISMLEVVDMPIVMGNASDKVKKVGKFITKKNSDDGVAYGIEKYIY